jgi:hypothetical protein
VRLTVTDPGSHPGFLDLPWDQPLEDWEHQRLVAIPTGLHRHPVRFVQYDDRLYAVKELPRRLAEREFRMLRALVEHGLPVVQPVGLVTDRGPAVGHEDALVTRYLEFSMPYRLLLGGTRIPYLGERLLDSLAGLLARLHLSGFFWGDCSLMNTLFRRDAGALSAYVVDMETGELHPSLTDGQRMLDLEIAIENIVGGLLDLQAAGRLDPGIDPWITGDELGQRYQGLWEEVTHDEVFSADEEYRVEARIRRLNDLGFDVAELELVSTGQGDGAVPAGPDRRVRLVPRVVEMGYHRPRLATLTGLDAEENQARSLLNDIQRYRTALEYRRGRSVPESIAAAKWLDEVFEPALRQVPADLAAKLPPAEVFHQLLEHRWFLSERAGTDVGMDAAVSSYVSSVLPGVPDSRTVFVDVSTGPVPLVSPPGEG